MSEIWTPTHRYYKGGLYRVVAQALHSETEEPLTVYESEEGRAWVRPRAMFEERLPDGRQRFVPLADLWCRPSPCEWWPEFIVDEVMPPGRADPSDWIHDPEWRPKRSVELFVGDRDEPDEADGRWLKPGMELDFVLCERRGTLTVTVRPDGTWDAHGRVPPDTTHFYESGEPETLAGSLDELALNFVHNHPSWSLQSQEAEPERVEVDLAFWSEPIRFRLVLSIEQPVPRWRFVPVDPGAVPPAGALAVPDDSQPELPLLAEAAHG